MVRYHASTQVRKSVSEALEHVNKELDLTSVKSSNIDSDSDQLQYLALDWAMNRVGVDNTVVGLTSIEHVKFATQLAATYDIQK